MSNKYILKKDSYNMVVDNTFRDYMRFAATAGMDGIQQCMKRNLNNVRAYNAQSYETILKFYNDFGYWGLIDPDKGVYELMENRAAALHEHHEDLTWLYGRLCDYRSKRTLLGVVENWLTFSMISLSRIIENTFRQYFDLDIMRCSADEVLVDLGAYTGDTVKDYLESYAAYKRIYCYEIVPNTFEALKNSIGDKTNIICRQKGAGDSAGTLYVSDGAPNLSMHKLSDNGTIQVPVVAIDEDIGEAVTFIKMDIEGGEQAALRGCKRHIQASHPKLAISVYHNNEDIWRCARMINQMDDSYRFYLRYNGGNYYPSECVLLGV